MRQGKREKKVKQVEKVYDGKNLMLNENGIKSETDEWTDGARNEMIPREMKGERGWMLCDILERKKELKDKDTGG